MNIVLSKLLRLLMSVVYAFMALYPSLSFAMQSEWRFEVAQAKDGVNFKVVQTSDKGQTKDLFDGLIKKDYTSNSDVPFTKLWKGNESTGFSGILPSFGAFVCDWDGNFSLAGSQEHQKNQTAKIEITSSGLVDIKDLNTKHLKIKSKEILFDGSGAIENADFTQAFPEISDVFWHIQKSASVTLNKLILNGGKVINEGLLKIKSPWLSRPKYFQSAALILSHCSFTNQGMLDISSLNLNKSVMENKEEGSIECAQGFKKGAVVSHTGESQLFNQGTLTTNTAFSLLLIKNTGNWYHHGKVHAAPYGMLNVSTQNLSISGTVTLENGSFSFTDSKPVTLTNTGKLTLKSYEHNKYTSPLTLVNQGHLTLLEPGLSQGYKDPLGVYLKNEKNKKVIFKDGIHILKSLENSGEIEFDAKDQDWTFGQPDKGTLVFASGPFSKKDTFKNIALKKNYLDNELIAIKGSRHFDWHKYQVAETRGKVATVMDQETFDRTMLTNNFQNFGEIKINGSIEYCIANTPGKIRISKNLIFPKLCFSRYKRSLNDLNEIECLEGKVDIELSGDDDVVTQPIKLTAIKDLALGVNGPFKVLSKLTVQQLTLTCMGFDLGQDNTKRGVIEALTGKLSIESVSGPLNAKYGDLFSAEDMTLTSRVRDVTIGDFVHKPYDREKWLGITQSPSGHEATTQIFDLNGTKLATNGKLTLKAGKQVIAQGAKTRSADTNMTAGEKIAITRSELEGSGSCSLNAPVTTIETKGKSPAIYIWGKPCDNDCGHHYAFYGYPFLSDRSVLSFMKDISFSSKDITLSGVSLLAGEEIIGSDLKNIKATPLTESCSAISHECKHHKRLRSYAYNHSYSKEIPNVILAGQKIIIQGGDFTGSFNSNTQELILKLKTRHFWNNNPNRQQDTPQVNQQIDLTQRQRDEINRGNSLMKIKGQSFEPIFQMPGFKAPLFTTVPHMGSFGQGGHFNPMENVYLDWLLQGVFGQFLGKLHMGGLSGTKLIDKIVKDSQKGRQTLINEDLILNSKDAILYYKPGAQGAVVEAKLMLHLPKDESNPLRDQGDHSATIIESITEGDQIDESTRLHGDEGVILKSKSGDLLRTRKVHTLSQGGSTIQQANAVQEVVSKNGSVREEAVNISHTGATTKTKKEITIEAKRTYTNQPLILTNRFSEYGKRKGKRTHTVITVDHAVSGEMFAGENIDIFSSKNLFRGAQIHSDLGITISGDVMGDAVMGARITSTHMKSSGLFSNSSSYSYDKTMSFLLKNIFSSQGPIEFNGGNVDLKGTDFITPHLIDNSKSFSLGGSKFTEEHFYSRERSNVFGESWISKDSGCDHFIPSRIFGSFTSTKSMDPNASNLLTLSGVQLKGDDVKIYKNLKEEAPTMRQWFHVEGGKCGFSTPLINGGGDPFVSAMKNINTGDTRFDNVISSMSAFNESVRLGMDVKNAIGVYNNGQMDEALKAILSRYTTVTWGTQNYSLTQDHTYQIPVVMEVKDFVLDNDSTHLVGQHTIHKKATFKTKELTSAPIFDINQTSSHSEGGSVGYNFLSQSISLSANESRTRSDSNIVLNSTFYADNLCARIGTANLDGMNITGRDLDIQIDRDLTLSSLLSSNSFEQQSFSGSVTVGLNGSVSPGDFRFTDCSRSSQFINQHSSINGTEKLRLAVGGTFLERSALVGSKGQQDLTYGKFQTEPLREEHHSSGVNLNLPFGTMSSFFSNLNELDKIISNSQMGFMDKIKSNLFSDDAGEQEQTKEERVELFEEPTKDKKEKNKQFVFKKAGKSKRGTKFLESSWKDYKSTDEYEQLVELPWEDYKKTDKYKQLVNEIYNLKDRNDYFEAGYSGVKKGLSNLWNMVLHPYDNIIHPMWTSLSEASLVYAGQVNKSALLSRGDITTPSIMGTRAYWEAVNNFGKRIDYLGQIVDKYMYGSGPQRFEMASEFLTTLLVPGGIIKGFKAVNNFHQLGVPFPSKYRCAWEYFPENGPPSFKLLSAKDTQKLKNSNLVYVITEKGELRLANRKVKTAYVTKSKNYFSGEILEESGRGVGHADLGAGKPTFGAGEVKVVQGEIQLINNWSGCYQPQSWNLEKIIKKVFVKNGFTEINLIKIDRPGGRFNYIIPDYTLLKSSPIGLTELILKEENGKHDWSKDTKWFFPYRYSPWN